MGADVAFPPAYVPADTAPESRATKTQLWSQDTALESRATEEPEPSAVVRIERIARSSPFYSQAVELRERVLLGPIGIDMERLEAMFPGSEGRFEHFVAVVDHPKGERVAGVVCLLAEGEGGDGGHGKLMQMAVDPQRQREGIGRKLVVALERRAFGELGLTELFCHAREDAVSFYEGLGWEVVGEGFEEAGIPHRRMVFRAEEGVAEGAASAEEEGETTDSTEADGV